MKKNFASDNYGRRSGVDRREYSYNNHIPERRLTKDRRAGVDRRKQPRQLKTGT